MSEKKIDDGGPAAPVSGMSMGFEMVHSTGLSVRDYFAAKALVALIEARSHLPGDDPMSMSWAIACGVNEVMPNYFEHDGKPMRWSADVAIDAYSMADAMIAKRKVQP